jgi:hypothetical protein
VAVGHPEEVKSNPFLQYFRLTCTESPEHEVPYQLRFLYSCFPQLSRRFTGYHLFKVAENPFPASLAVFQLPFLRPKPIALVQVIGLLRRF